MEQPYLESVDHCTVCGGGEWLPHLVAKDHTLSQELFPLTRCAQCGFCCTNPRPGPPHIGRYYDSPHYISHTNAARGLQNKLYQWARRRAIHGKHRLIARYRSNGKVLDVGCGTGEFLRHLKSRGYLTMGVEPNLGAREQAIAGHSLEVFPRLEDIPAAEQFQIATFWHVLEHLHDPRFALKQVYARMAKGGLLLIAVPDRESWDADHYQSTWAAYDVPRHLSHFRRQDLQRVLIEHGFELVSIRPMWFDAPYVAMLSERYRGSGPLGALLRGLFIGSISNLASLITWRPTSSTLYVAKKA